MRDHRNRMDPFNDAGLSSRNRGYFLRLEKTLVSLRTSRQVHFSNELAI